MKITDKKNIEDILPLTPLQQGMLFHYLKDRESDYYCEQLCLTITGEIDLTRFRRAWALVLETNEVLRTRFIWERITKPMQVILKKSPLQFIFHDFSNGKRSENDQRNLVQEIKDNDRKNKFNLKSVPFKITLCKLGQAEYEMLISHHHILYDGWSNGILLKEFFLFYHQLAQKKSPQKPYKHKYKEYINWIQGQDVQKQREYWARCLRGFDTKSELSIKRTKGKNISTIVTGNSHYKINFSKAEREKIEIFTRSHKLTLACLLYSAWGILLQRYNNSGDVIFGTTVSGRSVNVKGIENIVGLFINTVPLRVQTNSSGHEKIKDFLSRINQELRERDAYESASLVEIKEYGEVGFAGELFDTIFVIENYPLDKVSLERNSSLSLSADSYSLFETTHYDLTVGITLIEDMEVEFTYNEDLFDETVIIGLSRHFVKIVEDMVDHPGKELAALEILSEAEKNKILFEFNNTIVDYPGDKTIQQLFARQVERIPGHIALVGPSREKNRSYMSHMSYTTYLSYRELNEKSEGLAHFLVEKGVKPATIVGIMPERSIGMVIGILGILKAGGAYLPIDPDYPQERINYMLKDSNAKILLTANEIASFSTGCAVTPEAFNHRPRGTPFHLHLSLAPTASLAYIIYTSGTTGRPKGVMIEHSALMNRLFWVRDKYGLNERDVILQATSFVFDVSVCEMFRWIPAGGRLCLLPPGGEKDPGQIIRTIARNGVTTADFIPAMLTLVLDYAHRQNLEKELAGLRWVWTGVEVVDVVLVKRFNEILHRMNRTRLINAYGPTESTVDVTYFDCTHIENHDAVPIGKPMANVRVYILSINSTPQPVGVYGQLCIAGKGLARGYLNNPELTAEKFVKYRSYWSYRTYINIKLYKTGDLARWLSDGNIEFLGRMDYQVKIRGFRIELREIEDRLLNYPGIKEAVVSVLEEEKGGKYLCAYVVSDVENAIPGLREFLATELPDYMIPAYFMPIEKIPLTSSGKLDRKALPKPELKIDEGYTAPGDTIEKKLVEIWSEVLGRDELHVSQMQTSIGIHDNFFRLGGHSLKATILVSKIHKIFDVIVPVAEIFKTPTIKELAKYIKGKSKEFHISIEPAEEKEYYELSPAQKRLYILQQLVADNTGYNMPDVIPLDESVEKKKLESVFKKLIQRHESLRTSFITVNETPVQRIHREADFSIGWYEIDEEAEADSIIPGFTKPFNLSSAPLLRVNLIRVGSSRRVLFVDMHHIIMDGTSQSILEKEFRALLAGKVLQPLCLRLRYKDYSEWYNNALRQKVIDQQESYWLKEFSDELPVLDLPGDYPRPSIQGVEGNVVNFSFNVRETGVLKAIAKENETTLYITLLAIFNILLAKLSGQEDIIIGTPIAARRHADLANVMGMLVNTLAMRNYPCGDKPFGAFLKEVSQRSLDAYENQEYPFEVLVDKLAVNRDAGRNPVFDVLLNLLNQEDYRGEIPADDEQPVYHHIKRTSRFDMAFSAVDMDDKIYFTVEYSTRLYTPGTIEKFIRCLKHIIISLSGNIDKKLSEIDFIPVEEKERILDLSPGVNEIVDKVDLNMHGVFEEKVRECPDKTALVFAGSHLSYGELNRRANRLARFLRKRAVAADTVVGLMIDRSLEMVIAILAILKAGGAYMPLDPEYPPQRILTMLNDSQVSLLLTRGKLLNRFSITALKDMRTGKSEEGLIITPPRAQIKDFNAIPIPNRTLIDYKKYHQYIGEAPVKHSITLQATRGCPFNCSFCHKIWPKTHVARSAENIFKEISYAYDGGVRRFVFIDDIFNLDQKNAARFLETVIKSKMDIQLFFPNGFRADILSKEFIDLMIAAGTVNLDVALESASPRIQKLVRKNLNLDKFKENVQYIAEKYPHVILEIEMMHGFPTETEAEALLTLDFLKEIKWVHFPNLHILKIFPNTDMYRLAIENGISGKLIQRSTQLAYHELPETLPFPRSFTQQFQARFMGEYFLSRERLLHVLPQQMKVLSEDELVQKYDSYLSSEIKSFNDILRYIGISRRDLGDVQLNRDHYESPQFTERIRRHFPRHVPRGDAFRVLMLDLSQLFIEAHEQQLHHQVEEPLGLMYLSTYLEDRFKERIHSKICKSRIDFDSYRELKRIILEFKPRLIGIRTLSYYKEFFHHTVMMIRQWKADVLIVTGGPYATSDFQLILQDKNVDLVVLGEGELTLGELVEKMIANQGELPDEAVLAGIHGIAFAKNRVRRRSREIVAIEEISPGCSRSDHDNLHNLRHGDRPSDLLYVIYTSGSTGTPKGVMLEHRHLLNLIRHQYTYTSIDFRRVLQFTTLGFDVSAQEIFSTLLAGGSLVLINKETQGDIPRLLEVLRQEQVETLFLPASFLKYIMNEEEFIKHIPVCIKHIVSAGEQVVINERFRNYLIEKRVYFHNHYGPAETHVVTVSTLQPGVEIPGLPHIGRPVMNTRIYLLDRGLHLVPIGVPGQLVIGGSQVGRGYMNNPALTAERFVAHELHELTRTNQKLLRGVQGGGFLEKSPPGRRRQNLYKTGDLARWLPDGSIEFLGRIDHQVKIRGFRVELGEIEKRLLNHPGIKEAVVLVREEERRDKYICAYIVSNRKLLISELREYLSMELPGYMIPSYFVMIKKIPLTPNRKIDRKALPKPGIEVGESYIPPRNEIEKKLAALWSDVLGGDALHASQLQSSIGIDDNFFQLGGHSLKAVVLAAKIHAELNVNVPLAGIFKTPNIRGLAAYIEEAVGSKPIPVQPVEKKEYYSLSSAQRRLYILQQMDEKGIGYSMPSVWLLEGGLDVEKFTAVFQELIQRHESLRTSFHMVNAEPVQRIKEESCGRISNAFGENLATEGTVKKSFELKSYINSFIRAFDLSQAPLFRLELIKLLHTPAAHRSHPSQEGKEDRYLLMVDMHHIISDGVSIEIFVKEFTELYRDKRLEALRLQYRDYSQWHHLQVESKFIREQQTYWLKQFEGKVPVLELPSDYLRPKVQSFAGRSLHFEVNKEAAAALKSLARDREVTLFILLFSVYTVFLSKLSGQEDIVVGTPIAGRQHVDLQGIIGMFVNTLALRNFPVMDKTFDQFLEEIKENTIKTFENQDYPYEDLVEQVEVERDTGRNPLFDTMFVLQNMDVSVIEIPGLKVQSVDFETYISKFDLTLVAVEAGGGLRFTLEYRTALFKEETIERFINYFIKTISTVIDSPGMRISEIEILGEKEKSRILHEFNDTVADYPLDKTIHRLFEEQVERTPDQIALVGSPGIKYRTYMTHMTYITYRQLNEKSRQLACYLIEKGVRPDTIVGVMIERCVAMIIGILGILKAGGAYMPIDPAYPQERIDYLLKDSQSALLLTASTIAEAMNRSYKTHMSYISPASLAYVIYTSGSTGKPKGAMIEHHSVINRLNWMQEAYPIGPGDVILQKTPVVFDVSVWELFWWSFYGAGLSLLGPGEEKDPGAIVAAIGRYRVTTMHFVPSMLNAFLVYFESLPERKRELKQLKSLRQVFSSGEALSVSQVERYYQLFKIDKPPELINLYGPTEATVDVSYFHCPFGVKLEKVPIGKPIDNIRLYVLDRGLQLQPIGISGELYIAGVGLARGYLNNPGLTAEKFDQDLWDYQDGYHKSYRSYTSYIIYKTGDLARWLEDGNIEFLGRIDNQVKVRGFRVELEEIEILLTSSGILPVKEAAAVARPDPTGDNRVIAYIVPDKRRAYTVSRLLELGKQESPSSDTMYQWPNRMPVYYLNRTETDFMYKEIFADRSYLKHGISLKEGSCVFDVGANIGVFSLFVHRYCKNARIYSFEPLPPVYRVLTLNTSLYDGDFQTFNYGIGSGEGEAVFTYYPHVTILSGSSADREQTAGIVRAFLSQQEAAFSLEGEKDAAAMEKVYDELLAERLTTTAYTCKIKSLSQVIEENEVGVIDLIKIDVEKAEMEVLAGIKEEHWPLIRQLVIEVHETVGEGNVLLPAITRLLENKGYRIAVEQEQLLENTRLYNLYAVRCSGGEVEEPKEPVHEPCQYSVEDLVQEARDYLMSKLPGYMVPAHMLALAHLPLTASGKIDRKALPEPGIIKGKGFTPPQNETEEKLAGIWSEVLGLPKEKIGIHDNFFHLGGHSLKAALLAAHIHKKVNVNIPLLEIFRRSVLKDLADYIKKKAAPLKYISIEPVEAREYYDLSSAQKRLYIIQQTDPGSTVYNIPAVMTLIGEPDRVKFAGAFKKLIQRHESLRTSFHMLQEKPIQRVHDNVDFEIEYFQVEVEVKVEEKEVPFGQVSDAFGEEGGESATEIISSFKQPFDFARAPLLRVRLIRQDTQKHILMIDMNHIISDGISMGVLENEFMALIAGKDPGPLRIRYRDWAQWQNHDKNSERVKNQEAYWIKEFEGKIPVLNLPCDYTRPTVRDFTGKRVNFALSTRETGDLNSLARQEEVTLYMLLLSVYYVLLYKLTGQEDIVIGAPTAGRFQVELQKIIGMFLNTLALRNFPRGGQPFKIFLKEVKTKVLSAFDHQEYQFDDLVERLRVKKGGGRNPLFDVMFILQNQGTPEIQIPGLKLIPFELEQTTTKFDFSLYAEEVGHELLFGVTFREKLFTPATITIIIDYFKAILVSVLKNPHQALADIDVIPGERRTAILSQLNTDLEGEAVEFTAGDFFQASLNRSLHRFKDHLALECEERSLSFGELDRRADRLCRRILRQGIAPETFIGILMEERIDFIATMMGILKAGGVMVPLYSQLPVQRLEDMMQTIELGYIFADTFNIKRFEGSAHAAQKRVVFINLNDIFSPRESLKRKRPPAVSYSGADRCYVYFTSGSTGKPKPIVGKNRSLLHFISWEIKTFGVTNDFRVSQFTIPTFDPFLRDVFVPLLAGAKSCIPGGKETLIDVARLAHWVDRRQINLIHCVPALFRLLSSSRPDPANFKSLKFILLAGEKINPTDLVDWYKVFGDRIQLVNIYGPTETTLAKVHYLIKSRDIYRERIPIGNPIKGARVIILDKDKRLCAPLQVGEICIRTPFRSFGYYNDLKLNKEKFITNPYSDNPRDILYRSGDLGRVLSDGNVDILGRIDRQVKIRGYRIEMEEVELALVKEPLVKEAVVTIKGNSQEREYLCAYITITADQEKNSDFDPISFIGNLKQDLSARLPDYMVPANIFIMASIPRRMGGKVDYDRLPDLLEQGKTGYIPPAAGIEKKLVKIWGEILKIDKIGRRDHFFELGGNSLNVVSLASKIHKEFQVKISLEEIFRYPTLEKQSQLIKEAGKDKFLSIAAAEKKEYYRSSAVQQRIYFLQQTDLKSTAYNITQMMLLEGSVDRNRWEGTFKKLLQRHESLRTSLAMRQGELIQGIHEMVPFGQINAFGGSDPEGTRGLAPLSLESAAALISPFIRPFDLSRAPLLRMGLVKMGKNHSLPDKGEAYMLFMDIHHIISDLTSISIIMKDFLALYEGKELLPLSVQYKDYAEWENSKEQRDAIKRQEEYWLKEFAGDTPTLHLPLDYPRTRDQFYKGRHLEFMIGKEETSQLQALVSKEDVTLCIMLVSIFNILLAKLSGQEDIVIGTPVAGRRHEDLQNVTGMFVKTLPLRNYPQKEKTFKEFLAEVKERTLQAFENQDYPFQDLVEQIKITREAGRNPLFDVLFQLNNIDIPEARLPGLTVIPYRYEIGISKFDLGLRAVELNEAISFDFEYADRLFKKETIERLVDYIKNLVAEVIRDINIKLSEINVLTAQEKQQCLYDFNDTAKAYPGEKTIHQLFEEQVEKTPDNIAVVGPLPVKNRVYMTYITYKELNEEANRLAHILITRGIVPGTIAAILAEPSCRMIVVILAILKAGGAYLPISPGLPRARKKFMLRDSGVKLLIIQRHLSDTNKALMDLLPPRDILYLEDEKKTFAVEEISALEANPGALPVKVTPRSPGYVIYTSGSTGRPKGVVVEHRGIVNYICWAAEQYVKEEKVTFPLFTSFSFDLTVTSIFTPLVTGNTMVIYQGDEKEFLIKKVIEENRVNLVKLTPAHLKLILEIMAGNSTFLPAGEKSNIKRFVVGGENLSARLAGEIYEKFNRDIEIYNEYGPTETVVGSMIYQYDPAADKQGSVPIGAPIANTCIYLLDQGKKPVPLGVAGELFISGAGVGRGYLNQPGLTAEKFLDNPFLPGERMYAGGDLARRLDSGSIEFLGRKDHQVKIRGYRIELAEIQNKIKNFNIKDAVVLDKEDNQGDRYLCAYIVLESSQLFDIDQLRRGLALELPGYMIPQYFIRVDEIPLDAIGKVDRKTLLEKPGTPLGMNAAYMAPRDEEEKTVAEICREVLKIDKLGITDNFFSLGATSFNIIRISTKLQEVFKREIPVITLFEYPTIAAFMEYLHREKQDAVETPGREDEESLAARKRGRDRARKIKNKRKEEEDNEQP